MRYISVSLLTIFLLASCSQADMSDAESEAGMEETVESAPEITKATAVLSPTDGSQTAGVVTFTQTDEGVRIEATVSGLEAEARHGFHIHQFGDCRAPDGTSAGGHFNPEDVEHGAPTADIRHVGDLGNLPTNAQGTAEVDFVDTHVDLNGPNSVLGRGVIVHAGTDDFESQPTGAAGSRLACGVIGVANPDVVVE
ncbi:MAG: superoxide dismutase family protein [Balneolaceae bacterium]|nr:superoxide dismutase family protein [Balneolaceae bacterium]MDR9409167.1 superoxide dismutase family protein [Balneolaceae bacterium]